MCRVPSTSFHAGTQFVYIISLWWIYIDPTNIAVTRGVYHAICSNYPLAMSGTFSCSNTFNASWWNRTKTFVEHFNICMIYMVSGRLPPGYSPPGHLPPTNHPPDIHPPYFLPPCHLPPGHLPLGYLPPVFFTPHDIYLLDIHPLGYLPPVLFTLLDVIG